MVQPVDYPRIIKEVGFDFSWDERKVWQLSAPEESMSVALLEWHLDIPFLWDGNGVYNLKPRDVMNAPAKYRKEYDRTMVANLKFPIDIMENKGRWTILDGLHRLMKASILGINEVKVRKISRECIPLIGKDS